MTKVPIPTENAFRHNAYYPCDYSAFAVSGKGGAHKPV